MELYRKGLGLFTGSTADSHLLCGKGEGASPFKRLRTFWKAAAVPGGSQSFPL